MKSNHKFRVLIDVDDVVANFVEEVLRWYNLDFEDSLKPEDIKEWNIFNYIKPSCGNNFIDYFKNKSLYKNVKPVLGAKENIAKIEELNCDIFYCTAVVPGAEGIKYQWLLDNGFLEYFMDSKRQYIEITEKYLLDGNYAVIIDDGFHNIERFNGNRILFKRPWNIRQYREKDKDLEVYHTDDWNEIYKIIQSLVKGE